MSAEAVIASNQCCIWPRVSPRDKENDIERWRSYAYLLVSLRLLTSAIWSFGTSPSVWEISGYRHWPERGADIGGRIKYAASGGNDMIWFFEDSFSCRATVLMCTWIKETQCRFGTVTDWAGSWLKAPEQHSWWDQHSVWRWSQEAFLFKAWNILSSQ